MALLSPVDVTHEQSVAEIYDPMIDVLIREYTLMKDKVYFADENQSMNTFQMEVIDRAIALLQVSRHKETEKAIKKDKKARDKKK